MAKKSKTKGEISKVETRPRKTSENWVVMSNAVVRAAHRLSFKEKQVLMMAVSKMNPRAKVPRRNFNPEPTPVVTITVDEFAETYSIPKDAAYAQLKSACDRFYERSIDYYGIDGERGRCRWIGEQKYHDGKSFVTLEFYYKILPQLMDLEKEFTAYRLRQAANLRSKHSWRLLELLTSVADKNQAGILNISVDEFAHAMEATEKQKQDFNAIRRKIIEPAVKELREKDNWLIDYSIIKAGRKVDRLKFTFYPDPQERMF